MNINKALISTIVDVIWLACLWFGLFEGVDGALNVGLFISWLCFFSSLVLYNKKSAREVMDAKPAWSIARSCAFDIAATLMLIWADWWITGIAVTWAAIMVSGSWFNVQDEKKRAADNA